MMLYRGFKEKPIIMNPELHAEYQRLSNLGRRQGDTSKVTLGERARALDEPTFTRWYQLLQAKGPQFFTDDEAMARGFADKEGFVIRLEIPDDIATQHYQGDQTMTAGKERARLVSNFVFNGDEVSEFFASERARVIDIKQERHEGRPPSEGRPPVV